MWGSGQFSLFLKTDEPTPTTLGLDLVVAGAAGSGALGGVTLHTYSDASGNVLGRGIPVSLEGAATGALAAGLPLWVGAAYPRAAGGLPLAGWNASSGTAAGQQLFVRGSGTTAGALPFSRDLGLFLRRNPGGAIPLTVGAPGTPSGSGVTLFVRALVPATGLLTLSLPEAVGAPAGAAKLYTHGF